MRALAIATSSGDGGGIQRYSASVVRALRSSGYETTVVETAASRSLFQRTLLLLRIVNAMARADVIWILHPRLSPVGCLLARLFRKPVIVSTYGFETWGRFSPAVRLALRCARTVTVISYFSEALLPERLPSTYLLRPYSSLARGKAAGRNPSDRDSVLFVGRLDEDYKGTDIALALARDLPPSYKLVLAGWAPPDYTAAATRENVEIHIRPTDDELWALYSRAAVVVLPSAAIREGNRWTGGEGFGIVLLEAAHAGCAVVASVDGACPETVALLQNGVIAPPTPVGFRTAVLEMLSNPADLAAFGERGMRAAAGLNEEAFVEQVAEIARTTRSS